MKHYLNYLLAILCLSASFSDAAAPILRNIAAPTKYEYQVEIKNLYGPAHIAVNPVDNRVFFAQQSAYRFLDHSVPVKTFSSYRHHQIWKRYGDDLGVFELGGNEAFYRFSGTSDPWGSMHFIELACTNDNQLYVYADTYINEYLYLYDLKSNKEVLKVSSFSGKNNLIVGMTVNPRDNQLYLHHSSNGILTFDLATKVFTPWLKTGGTLEKLVTDGAGNLYTTSPWFTKIAADKTMETIKDVKYPGLGHDEWMPSSLTKLAFNPVNKTIWIGNEICITKDNVANHLGYCIYEFDPETQKCTAIIEERGETNLTGMAINSNGNAYLAVDDKIVRLTLVR